MQPTLFKQHHTQSSQANPTQDSESDEQGASFCKSSSKKGLEDQAIQNLNICQGNPDKSKSKIEKDKRCPGLLGSIIPTCAT